MDIHTTRVANVIDSSTLFSIYDILRIYDALSVLDAGV